MAKTRKKKSGPVRDAVRSTAKGIKTHNSVKSAKKNVKAGISAIKTSIKNAKGASTTSTQRKKVTKKKK